jgi:hypothetical protein
VAKAKRRTGAKERGAPKARAKAPQSGSSKKTGRKKPAEVPSAKPVPREFAPDVVEKHLERLRRICLALPNAIEKLSHGEPTFFTPKKSFAMFSENHHDDGHLAVVLPVGFDEQERLIEERPACFYFPAYVGVSGWVGVELDRVGDAELESLVHAAWRRVAPKRALKAAQTAPEVPRRGAARS